MPDKNKKAFVQNRSKPLCLNEDFLPYSLLHVWNITSWTDFLKSMVIS